MNNLIDAKTPPGGAERGSTAPRVLESLLPCWAGSSQSNFSLSVLFLVCLFIICGATAFIGAVPTRIYGHDDFFLLDNGWRIVCGQRPHLDFYSPWGPVMFLVVGLGLELSEHLSERDWLRECNSRPDNRAVGVLAQSRPSRFRAPILSQYLPYASRYGSIPVGDLAAFVFSCQPL